MLQLFKNLLLFESLCACCGIITRLRVLLLVLLSPFEMLAPAEKRLCVYFFRSLHTGMRTNAQISFSKIFVYNEQMRKIANLICALHSNHISTASGPIVCASDLVLFILC